MSLGWKAILRGLAGLILLGLLLFLPAALSFLDFIIKHTTLGARFAPRKRSEKGK